MDRMTALNWAKDEKVYRLAAMMSLSVFYVMF